jgi:hypothetical protein
MGMRIAATTATTTVMPVIEARAKVGETGAVKMMMAAVAATAKTSVRAANAIAPTGSCPAE